MTSETDNGPLRNDRPVGRPADTEVPDSPGARLRQTRQVKKLDINYVATALHLSRPVVEAIERNDYDRLPSAVFVAGYIRSYARLLGLDPEPLNESFRRLHPGAEAPPRQVARGGRDSGERERSNLPLYLFLLVLLLAIGGGIYVWWMNQAQLEEMTAERLSPDPEAVGATAPTPGTNAPARLPPEAISSPPPASTLDEPTDNGLDNLLTDRDAVESLASNDGIDDGIGGALDTPATPESPPTSRPAATTDDALTAGAPAAAEDDRPAIAAIERPPLPTPPAPEAPSRSGDALEDTGADDALASAAPDLGTGADTDDTGTAATAEDDAGSEPSGDTVALNFTGPCWVDVRDATGEVLLFGEMSRGDREALDGEPPYSLVLGNAAAVEVTVGGEPYDIRSIARGNVARFELDPAEFAASATAASE